MWREYLRTWALGLLTISTSGQLIRTGESLMPRRRSAGVESSMNRCRIRRVTGLAGGDDAAVGARRVDHLAGTAGIASASQRASGAGGLDARSVAEKRNLQLDRREPQRTHCTTSATAGIAEAQPPFATPENIKMYYCESGKTGSTVSEVEVDRFGQISNWPERFMGDISGDLHSMLRAALERRSQELERVGSGS